MQRNPNQYSINENQVDDVEPRRSSNEEWGKLFLDEETLNDVVDNLIKDEEVSKNIIDNITKLNIHDIALYGTDDEDEEGLFERQFFSFYELCDCLRYNTNKQFFICIDSRKQYFDFVEHNSVGNTTNRNQANLD